MSFQAMKRRGGALSAYHEVKEASRFQPYDILEKAELRRQKKGQWFQGLRGLGRE